MGVKFVNIIFANPVAHIADSAMLLILAMLEYLSVQYPAKTLGSTLSFQFLMYTYSHHVCYKTAKAE